MLLKGLLKDGPTSLLHFETVSSTLPGPLAEESYAQVLLWRFCLSIDAGLSYEEVGHVLKGEIGQRTAGRTHLLIKDRGQFIVGPNVPIDRKEYTITTLKSSVICLLNYNSLPHQKRRLNLVQIRVDDDKCATSTDHSNMEARR